MQALSIYILIRLCEGETEYNNFDVLLLSTVTARLSPASKNNHLTFTDASQIVSKQLVCTEVMWSTPSILSKYGLEYSWKEWLFEESRRRLGIVYRVMNMLVFFEPASLCELQTDLVLAPLPAKKQLWEAPDEFAWKAVNEKTPGIETDFALAADGDLVKLEGEHSYCTYKAKLQYRSLGDGPPRKSALWEEWCSSMDSFGGLVMLTASLVG